MNDIQAKLYQIITKFDALCQKFGITYYLGGGSALGALRHKGFLPWDDDMDLYITRKNYEKLLLVQDEFFDDDFVLVTTEKFPKYRNTIVRCVDTKSTAITKARIVDHSPKGQFVELFILDPMPKDLQLQQLWLKKHWIYAELLSVAFRVANNRIIDYVDPDMYNEYKARCEEFGYDTVLKELEEELFNIDEADADEYCSRWGFRNLIYKIDWFQKPRYLPFEDTKLPVATYAENVARFDYGDNWMYIPRKEEQITHSFAESMHIPYTYYVEDYKNFFDPDQIYLKYEKRKKNLLDYYFETIKIDLKRLEIAKQIVLSTLEYNKDFRFEEKLESEEFDEIENFFGFWYQYQLDSKYLQAKIFIAIPDDALYCALIPLLLKGEYSNTIKILSFRNQQGNMPIKLQTLYDFSNAIRQIYIAIDNHNHVLAKTYLEQAEKIHFEYANYQFNFKILNYKYQLDKALEEENTNGTIDTLLSDIKKFSQRYPQNGEIMYLLAECYFHQKNYTSALKWYEEALSHTQHGFVHMHIKDRKNQIERITSHD